MKRLYGALLVLYGIATMLLVAGVAFYVYSSAAGTDARQPIAYNHKKHMAAGLECANCHQGIADGKAHAQLPAVEVCATCHTSEDENPAAKVVRDYVSKNKPIPWKKIYNVPDNVYFSHRRHVGIGKLDCAVCHGDILNKETPVTRQAVAVSMEHCMKCHHSNGVRNDCLDCHR